MGSYDNRENDSLYLQIKDLLIDNPNLGRYTLSQKTGASEKACRNRLKWWRREQGEVTTPVEQLLKYLSKAKTGKQLSVTYGQEWESIIRKKIPDYFLCDTQWNEFGEKLYIILPQLTDPIKVKPKIWNFYIGKDSEDGKDPCLTVNFPDSAFRNHMITLAPIFDSHVGHFSHRKEKFLSYINWIRQEPNVFAMLGGDIMENALDDGRGMTYDSTPPKKQYEELIDMLSPIAHKIICSVPGNHERRSQKRAGFEPTFFICEKLKIPYFSGPVMININAGGYARRIYLHHGRGNSQTKGGKLNSAQRPHKFVDGVHFNISGHVHDLVCDPETVMYYNPITATIEFYTRWTVIAPSFLGWKNTYAYEGEYGPPAMGGVAIKLYDDGHYKATFA